MNTTFERKTMKEEWLTPRFIIDALAPFDLDPCASVIQPWPTAKVAYTINDNGLSKPWQGFVWCNPPYGNQTKQWLGRMAEHNNGIALTFARTETRMFFECVWPKALAIYFIRGRLSFCDTKGNSGNNSAGAPSCLIAYGPEAYGRLVKQTTIPGWFVSQIKPT
jgi:hypothetical protein